MSTLSQFTGSGRSKSVNFASGSGTWTVPVGVTHIKVLMVSGGDGGKGGNAKISGGIVGIGAAGNTGGATIFGSVSINSSLWGGATGATLGLPGDNGSLTMFAAGGGGGGAQSTSSGGAGGYALTISGYPGAGGTSASYNGGGGGGGGSYSAGGRGGNGRYGATPGYDGTNGTYPGGGGGGGGAVSNTSVDSPFYSGSGGRGGCTALLDFTVNPGDSISYTVGAGGTGGAGGVSSTYVGGKGGDGAGGMITIYWTE